MPKSIFLSNNKYFEAVIQLRPYNNEVYLFIEHEIKSRKGVFISKIEELKTGIDIYISSQRFARSTLGPKLKRKFKDGELKITRKMHTQDRMTSKKLYRATILFRMPKDEEEAI
ncbi:MAG TPA: NMD3-related protein [Candidatus Nanoarchaeia archaeon]|nr:NMD3-related protein [Candidatus Nanoarchaeia archaeon]